VFDDDTESSLHERIKIVERTLYPMVLARVMASLDEGLEPESVAGMMGES
jgi:folate-dependent phosphoribosylglycinamide formyltransferase PurN